MGIGDKLNQMTNQIQSGVKNTTSSLFSISLKIVTGFFIGLVFALIGQEVIWYGTFSFLFMLVMVNALIFKLLQRWTIGSVLVFDLICILLAMLMRMYILIAP